MTPEIIKSYINFCNARNTYNGGKLDLSHIQFFYPTLLVLSYNFIIENSTEALVSDNVVSYVRHMLKPSTNREKTFVHLQELKPMEKNEVPHLIDEIMSILDRNYGGINALNYLLEELTVNIYDHSIFQKAFLMAQKYQSKGFTEVCIYDNGITIPGSFEKYDISEGDDSQDIMQAMHGKSTKNELGRRGFGLKSVAKMFTEGTNGEIFIVSRKGAVHSHEKETLYDLKTEHILKGTLISIRIPKGEIDHSKFI